MEILIQTHAHPILFTAPMVRAILQGRKTQTRRIMKPQPEFLTGSGRRVYKDQDFKKSWESIRGTGEGFGYSDCPYGRPGDHLWVRETYLQWQYRDGEKGEIVYYDDSNIHDILRDKKSLEKQKQIGNWRIIPSIHMPRAASRITLQITDIRAERLQDITEADAVAEGCTGGGDWATAPTVEYSNLWETINGPHSWDANPWVWAITFKKI